MYVQCSSTERRNGLCSSTLRSVGLVSFSILFWWSGRRFANRRLLHYVPTASNRDGLVRRGSIKRLSSSRAALTSSCEHSLRRCPARGPTASNRDGLVRRGSVKRPACSWGDSAAIVRSGMQGKRRNGLHDNGACVAHLVYALRGTFERMHWLHVDDMWSETTLDSLAFLRRTCVHGAFKFTLATMHQGVASDCHALEMHVSTQRSICIPLSTTSSGVVG